MVHLDVNVQIKKNNFTIIIRFKSLDLRSVGVVNWVASSVTILSHWKATESIVRCRMFDKKYMLSVSPTKRELSIMAYPIFNQPRLLSRIVILVNRLVPEPQIPCCLFL